MMGVEVGPSRGGGGGVAHAVYYQNFVCMAVFIKLISEFLDGK
jgi:hypothetical protein